MSTQKNSKPKPAPKKRGRPRKRPVQKKKTQEKQECCKKCFCQSIICWFKGLFGS